MPIIRLFPHNIFRKYDIRWIYETELNEDLVYKYWRALATYVSRQYNITNPKIFTWHDSRLSYPTLYPQLIQWLIDSWADVYDAWFCTTPEWYLGVPHYKLDSWVVLTASHNPKDYNWFKTIKKDSLLWFDQDIQNMKNIILEEDFIHWNWEIHKLENVFDNMHKKYLDDLNLDIKLPVKVAVDSWNGVWWVNFVPYLKSLWIEVVDLFTEPDGNFPNHTADPSKESNMLELMETIKITQSDIGVGFDGDGDRCGIVDRNGKFYLPDFLLYIFAKKYLEKHWEWNIVIDPFFPPKYITELEKLWWKTFFCRTWMAFFKNRMKEVNAVLGWELAWHIWICDNFVWVDDAMVVALKIIEIVSNDRDILEREYAQLKKTYTTERIEYKDGVTDENKFEIVSRVKQEYLSKYSEDKLVLVDGIRVNYDEYSFSICRNSNTTPVLTLRFESDNEENLEKYKNEMLKILAKVIKNIN